MKHDIFSVFDTKAEAYLQPFFAVNKPVAIRHFTDLVNNQQHLFGQHPEDFNLFKIAEFDDQNGQITQLAVNQSLGLGIEFRHNDPGDDYALAATRGELA